MTSGNHRCAIATIAARNYLASLVLLGESVMVADPEADFCIHIIDAFDSELEDLRKWNAVWYDPTDGCFRNLRVLGYPVQRPSGQHGEC